MQCVRLGLELALLIYEFEHKVLWEPFCLFYVQSVLEQLGIFRFHSNSLTRTVVIRAKYQLVIMIVILWILKNTTF